MPFHLFSRGNITAIGVKPKVLHSPAEHNKPI